MIDIPLPILTPRLMLRPLHPDDADEIHAAKIESWDALSKWGIWIFKPFAEMSSADDAEFCRYKQAQFADRKDITLRITDRETGKFLGGAGLHKCDWEQRVFTLGFWIRSHETRKGFATETATALVHYAFTALGARQINSMHAQGNEASACVLHKLGFTLSETKSGTHSLPGGSIVDELHYTLGQSHHLPRLDV